MTQGAIPHKPSPFAVLKNRNFSLLLFGLIVSEFGTGITSIASSILVFRETGSAASVGLMLMAVSMPGLLLGFIAGVFVDRLDRKRTIIVTEIVSGILIFLVPFMLHYGIHWLYILVALKSAAYQFFNPALNSMLPDVASEEELAAANSLIGACYTGATGLGFAAAGFITSQLSPEWAFYIDSMTFFASAALIVFVSAPKLIVEGKSSVSMVIANLRVGARFLLNSPALRSVIIVTFPMGVIFGFLNSAMLPFAIRALGATEFEYSLMEGLGLIGFVLGSLTMSVFSDRLREGQWLAISFIGMGSLAVVFSQATTVWFAIVMSALILYFNVPSFIARSLIIQRNTTREIRGRVSSAYFVTRDFSFVLGMALVGIADVVDVRVAILVLGAALAGVGILSLFLPGLHRPTTEWTHAIEMLRGISEAPGLDIGRSITLDEMTRFGEIFPEMKNLSTADMQHLMPNITYTEAQPGTRIVHRGEVNDNCYFILEGQLVAGLVEGTSERILAILHKGEFFGEIAALTGQRRTADVIAREEAHLLRVPADTLRMMTQYPEINRALYSKMMERMMNLNMIEIPRAAKKMDAETMRNLRTETHEIVAVM